MVTLSPGIVSKLSMGECVRELTGLESEISHLGSTESYTDSGKRYVAICLAIARTKGVDMVTEMADQWLEYMFFKSE